MKWKLILMLALTCVGISSCEIGDEGDNFRVQYQVAAVTSVDMPATFKFGESNDIVVRFNNPSSCSSFFGFDVRPTLNEREVRVVLETQDTGDCVNLEVPQEETLTFVATSNGSYIFKFFTGLSSNGEAQFVEYTVEVEE
jgi:hypothetical protein